MTYWHWRHAACPPCRSDLLELASPAAVAAKMRSTQRMMRSYAIFQQF
jgi:hypothetical protein